MSKLFPLVLVLLSPPGGAVDFVPLGNRSSAECCPGNSVVSLRDQTCVVPATGEFSSHLQLWEALEQEECQGVRYLLFDRLSPLIVPDGVHEGLMNLSGYCADQVLYRDARGVSSVGDIMIYCDEVKDRTGVSKRGLRRTTITVPKCCKLNETFSLSWGACTPRDTEWRPQIFASQYISYGRWEVPLETTELVVTDGLLQCNTTILQPGDFYFLDTGQLYVPHVMKKAYVQSPLFCLEDIETVNPVTQVTTLVSSAAVCHQQEPSIVVKKCCNNGELYSFSDRKCVPALLSPTQIFSGEVYQVQYGSPSFCNPVILGTRDQARGVHTSFMLLANGNISVPCLEREFGPDDYCLEHFLYQEDGVNSTKLQGFLCVRDRGDKALLNEVMRSTLSCSQAPHTDHCHNRTCVPKCCRGNEVIFNNSCASLDPLWSPLSEGLDDSFTYFTRFPGCTDLLKIFPYHPTMSPSGRDNLTILPNGTLKIVPLGDEDTCEGENIAILPLSEYCLDLSYVEDSGRGTYRQVVYTCPPAIQAGQDEYLLITNSLLIISEVFLFIAFLVYLFVPDTTTNRSLKRAKVRMFKTLFGRIVVIYISSLFIAYLILILLQTLSERLDANTCIALGLLMQVSFLGTFFWLNVMCIDLWIVLGASIQPSKTKRFRAYLLWAIGGPLFIVFLTMVSEFVPNVVPCRFKPRLARYRCWFSTMESRMAFFMGPITLLLLGNISLFLLTVKKILSIGPKADRESAIEVKERKQRVKQRLVLCLKLSFVMGLAWIFEAIAHFLNSSYSLLIFRFLNSLQGLLVFIIFICKKNVLVKVKSGLLENWPKLTNRFSGRTEASSTTTDKLSIKMRLRNRISATNSAIQSGSFTFKKPAQGSFNGVFDRDTNMFVSSPDSTLAFPGDHTNPTLRIDEGFPSKPKFQEEANQITFSGGDTEGDFESRDPVEKDIRFQTNVISVDDNIVLIEDGVFTEGVRKGRGLFSDPSALLICGEDRVMGPKETARQLNPTGDLQTDLSLSEQSPCDIGNHLDTLDRHNIQSRQLRVGETKVTKIGVVSRV